MKKVSEKSLVGFCDNIIGIERLRSYPLVCRILIVELQNLALGLLGNGSGNRMILHDRRII